MGVEIADAVITLCAVRRPHWNGTRLAISPPEVSVARHGVSETRPASARRIVELDALRGLAAVSVVIWHSFLVFPSAGKNTRDQGLTALNVLKYSPIHALWAGPQAVFLFFVLSGFVLSLPYLGPHRPRYVSFAIRRITRIWPAYAVCCLLAFAFASMVGRAKIAVLSPWFNSVWQGGATSDVVMRHLLLVDHFANGIFDPVLWSLVYEMRISFVFPIVLWLCVRLRPPLLLPVLVAWTIWSVVLTKGESPINGDYLLTLQYIPYFVAGIMLARHRHELVVRFGACRKLVQATLVGGTLALYTWPWWGSSANPWWMPALSQLLELAACSGFILMALGLPSLNRWLRTAPLQYLGRISYSLYLVHAIVLLFLIHVLFGRIPTPMLLLAVWAGSLALAALVEIGVERPSIALGRRLTQPALSLTQPALSSAAAPAPMAVD